MTQSISPWDQPERWDSINLAGVTYGWGTNPDIGGNVEVNRCVRHYRIDHKDPSGGDGSQPTYLGIQPREFDVLFHCWTNQQFDYLSSTVLPAITNRGKAPQGVVHPRLMLLGITNVIIETISFDHVGQEGDRNYVLKVIVSEFRRPPPVNVTTSPTKSLPATGSPATGQQPKTANQLAIEANNATIDRLKAQLPHAPP